MPNEGIVEAGLVERDLGGSGERAANTQSPSHQRVIEKGCNNSQRIAEIQGAEVVGDQRITKKQRVVRADEQHQRVLKDE